MSINKTFVKSNPKLTANFLNKLFFWWLKPLFYSKISENLELEGLYNVIPEQSSRTLGDKLESCWNEELKDSSNKKSQPSLLKATWNAFGWLFCYYGIHVFIICVILRGLQPYILGLLIRSFDPRSNSTKEEACIYASALIIMIVLQAIVGHHSVVGRKEVGMKMSIAYSALIFRKILRLSITTSNKYDTGMIINLLSNDVGKFEDVCMFLHYIWVLPIQGLLMAYFIWNNVGIASLAGILILAIQTIPVQGYLGKVTAKVRAKVAGKTDERVRLMSEIIKGIRVIKIYTWEKPFENLVFLARKCEVDTIAIKSYLRGLSTATSAFAESTSLFFIILTYVLLGNILEASIVYSVAQYFAMIKTMMTVFYPRAISSAAEARVSIERIEKFLLLDEVENKLKVKKSNTNDVSITIEDSHISWSNNSTDYVLHNVNLNFADKKFYIISGPVGSGKSTLLKAILGELKPIKGDIQVNASVSYVSQESWLFPDTIRNNIIFEQFYQKEKYEKVVEVCALKDDFERLNNGDLTVVGDRGCNLSGGQCARINLARAIYRDADIYLIDNALAAVDTHVGKHLLDNCISGFLKCKTRILVTQNEQYFKEADKIIIIDKGKVTFNGSYSDLILKGYQLPELLQYTPIENPNKNEKLAQNTVELKFINKKFKAINKNEEMAENKPAVKLACWKYFRSGSSILMLLCLVLSFLLAQASVSGCDYWLAHWIKQEENRIRSSSAEDSNITFELKVALYVFAVLLFTSIITWTSSSLLFYKVCMNASKNLHNQMFSSLLKTPISFFELNNPGIILNRFSKDIGLVDETLPTVTLDAIQIILMMAGITIQILIINWWSIIPLVATAIICWKFKNIYLPTAQNIKRLESKCKSPVFSHVNSTVSGLTIIRSSETENKIKEKFDSLQDIHTSVNYLNMVSSSAFGFWLDIISISLLAFVSYSFIIMKNNETFAAIVGLAITQILMLYGKVQYGLRQTTEMMTQMISVERIFQFTNLEREDYADNKYMDLLLNDWPNNGRIRFENVSLRYFEDDEPVLKNINLDIKSQEKTGIAGRTGAGKTSLISALFRLGNPNGQIFIDDIDTKNIGLKILRSKISMIPQEPILFTTSVRNNIDPLRKYNDETLIQALRDVKLDEKFESLDEKIENGGNNLSSGEKQLLCLARVVVANNKILILDEATANVDTATDEIIQSIIKQKFLNSTVITIAHRLNTILSSDKILVIDDGKVVEFDKPSKLLEIKDGYFSNMLNTT